MKTLFKILATMLLTEFVWLGNAALLTLMNQPSSLALIAGMLGVVVSIFIWYTMIDWMWGKQAREGVRKMIERIKHFYAEL